MKPRLTYSLIFLCCVFFTLTSCEKTDADYLEIMCGNWKSIKKQDSLEISKVDENNYQITVYKKQWNNRPKPRTYLIDIEKGNLFFGKWLSVLISYDAETDRIMLFPGGEYKRV